MTTVISKELTLFYFEIDWLHGDHVLSKAHVTSVVFSSVTGDQVGKVQVAVQTRVDSITHLEALEVWRGDRRRRERC